MKRGRPKLRNKIKDLVINALKSTGSPMTVNTITSNISAQMKRKVSWNTVRKYIQELVEVNKVHATVLPHSKMDGKKGLTVYTIKK